MSDATDDRDGVVLDGSLAWSAHAAYVTGAEPSATLGVMSLASKETSTLNTNGVVPIEPDWRPSGGLIAYAAPPYIVSPLNFDIYTVPVFGYDQSESDVRVTDGAELTTNPCTSLSPAWSPDGSALAYTTDCGGSWKIVILEYFSTEFQTPTEYIVGAHEPRSLAWLGNGHIVYEANFHLYVMDVSDGSYTPLTPASDTSVEVSDPVVSPDGNWIAFAYIQGAGRAIWAFEVPDLASWAQVVGAEGSFVVGAGVLGAGDGRGSPPAPHGLDSRANGAAMTI